MQITEAVASRNAVAYAVAWSKPWYFDSTIRVAVCVCPTTLPDTTLTAPNSPSERARLSTTPYTTAHLMLGSVIRRKVCTTFAPRLRAACSCSSPISDSTGTTSRMTSGSATKTVANTMPGAAKMTLNPALESAVPNSPVRGLYARTSASPTTTGDTDSGTSIIADSTRLPGNS